MTSTKPKKTGRPSLYTEALATRICKRLADGGSLRSICRDKAMPDKATVLLWLADKAKIDFRDQYAHAREMQTDALFDEALEIADDATAGTITRGSRMARHRRAGRTSRPSGPRRTRTPGGPRSTAKSHYGYKNHVNVDRRHRLVRHYQVMWVVFGISIGWCDSGVAAPYRANHTSMRVQPRW